MAHYSEWIAELYDNNRRMQSTLNIVNTEKFEQKLKKMIEDENDFYLNADKVICLSNYMNEILCRNYKFDPDKISIIPNGIQDVLFDNGQLTTNNVGKMQACKFRARSAQALSLRKKWRISDNELLVLFVGRLDSVKGLSFLIRAFRKVLQTTLNCRLIIVGSGNYDIYLQEAKGISAKITFTGFLENKELHELYQLANIGVMPSLYEPFGYVAVEMMMHGLPIIATATSGLNEVVDDTCGIKIPVIERPGKVDIDPDLLAEKIIYLLQHLSEAQKMGESGRKRYEKMYTSDIFRENMLNFYQSLF